MSKVLFICKKRTSLYGDSFGLLNSATFVSNALQASGIESKVVTVIDNNGIDKEVHDYNPSHVMIEALWVVPEKYEVLHRLHPEVKWITRIHSKIPFLSLEGIAIDWIKKYADLPTEQNVSLSANTESLVHDIQNSLYTDVLYLPNIYYDSSDIDLPDLTQDPLFIHIGCFGAIRPLKNQLKQAVAAIQFADSMNYRLAFHINGTRLEQNGAPILKNLQNLFADHPWHKLEVHPWLNHEEFIQLVRSMDIGMQVSFSESFNIVCADFVKHNIPVIGSPDIDWMPSLFQADPNSTKSIVNTLWLIWKTKPLKLYKLSKLALGWYNFWATKEWLNYLT